MAAEPGALPELEAHPSAARRGRYLPLTITETECPIPAQGVRRTGTVSSAGSDSIKPIGCAVPVTGLVTHAITKEPWVSITYDEHLGTNTPKILQSFDDYEMAGTFFTIGEEAAAAPDLTRAILSRGHELGNHSYNHARLIGLPDHGRRQYDKTLRTIHAITGFRTSLARPPFGQVNDDVIAAATSLGMTTVNWGPSPYWWDPYPGHMAEVALDGIKPGQIVLLHQTAAAAQALPLI